jgi:hypothetical protein
MPEGPVNHFSYSQLSTYLSCPLQYRLKNVDLIPPDFSPASLAFGSSIHEAVAAYYQSRLEGDTFQPHQMVDVYRETSRGPKGSNSSTATMRNPCWPKPNSSSAYSMSRSILRLRCWAWRNSLRCNW